jgi:hypothetical protein
VDSHERVRNHLLMPFVQCAGRLRSGERCRSAALTDSCFCSHHSTLADEVGEKRVRSGDHTRKRTHPASGPLVAEVEASPTTGNGADPAQVRPRLAEAAAASLDDISSALLDAALGATREIPDVRSRVAAIELLLREGLGRPPQAEEASSTRLPQSAEAVEKLGWDEMKAIFAAQFANEIVAVIERGGEELLRERVGALDADERAMLRTALDGLATARSG